MTLNAEAATELYVPKPGAVPWRVLTHLLVHPAEELMRKDVAALTGCDNPSVDTLLQLAVARGALLRRRNTRMEMIWCLGSVKTFRLDPLSQDGEQQQAQAAVAAPAPAPTPAPAPETKPAQTQAPELYVPSIADMGRDQLTAPVKTPVRQRQPAEHIKPDAPARAEQKPQLADAPAQVRVTMPLHLTPELIEAVRNDPATSFENKADGHHAIGWLYAAYDVMVKAQTQAAIQTSTAQAHSQ